MCVINYADHMLSLGRGYQFTFFSKTKYKIQIPNTKSNTKIQNQIQKYKDNYADHMLPLGRGYQFTFFSVKIQIFKWKYKNHMLPFGSR